MISDLLHMQFFRMTLLSVSVLAVVSSVIGTYVVSRRLVSLAGGITHTCFGGLGLGYFLGINPVGMAALFATASALGIEAVSRGGRVRQDSAVAVVWAVGMAIGVMFVFLTPGYVPELNGFLFGNVLSVDSHDLKIYMIYAVVLMAYLAFRFRMIVASAFDADYAVSAGIPAHRINAVMMVMASLCIVLTIKIAGIMLLMSMISLPQLSAEIFTGKFRTIMWSSALISLFCCVGGVFAGVFVEVPCSALIVVIMVVVYLILRAVKAIKG